MPYYEYRCDRNGRTVEVRHGMDDTVRTWGDACARAGVDPGDTPPGVPVERIMSVPAAPTRANPEAVSCGPGCACAHTA